MAVKVALATGNFLTAGTWGVIDATSYSNGENAAIVLPTAYGATARSVATTPGAITIRGILVKLNVRTGTTGTMTVHLATAADHVEVAGTAVTINTADLPAAVAADLNGGWIYFKFAGDVTLAGATTYEVEAKTSSASQVSLWRADATAGNIAIGLQTTTTGAPAAGDDLIITGIHTTTGAPAAVTVTMNETATTDYGAGSTSLVTPSLAIGNSGTLSYGTTAATNYYLRQSGNVVVYAGGTLSIGTTGSPIPRDGSAILNFDCASNVDFGLTVRNLGTFNAQGLSRTSGKNIVSCLLNTDEAANSTSLGVDTDTGWLDNDVIAVASTTRTRTDSESGTLNGAAGAATLTVDGFAGTGGGLAVAHSGTSPTQAEVILLTRNVQIFGASSSLQAYVDIKATATVDIDWTEFKWLGSATSNKTGIDIATTTGSFNMQFSSIHDGVVTGSKGINANAITALNNVTVSDCGFWNINDAHIALTLASSGTNLTFNNIICITNVAGVSMLNFNDIGGTITNVTAVSSATTGSAFAISEAAVPGTISNLTSHSHAGIGLSLSQLYAGTVSNITVWRCSLNGGLRLVTGPHDLTINTVTLFGNTPANLLIDGNCGKVTINGLVSNGDTTFSTADGIRFSGSVVIICGLKLNSPDFSTVAGIKTAHTNDLNISTTSQHLEVTLVNPKLGGTNEVVTQTNLGANSFVAIQKKDQTAGTHTTLKSFGTIATEGTITHTGSNSFSMTPNNASNKLVSGSFFIPVANGAALTPSVYTYENATYNGNRMRLILKRNDAIGITSDTVIDTRTGAADAVWEALTGTTAAATDDGVMEFVVDCDGTAGICYVDTFTVS